MDYVAQTECVGVSVMHPVAKIASHLPEYSLARKSAAEENAPLNPAELFLDNNVQYHSYPTHQTPNHPHTDIFSTIYADLLAYDFDEPVGSSQRLLLALATYELAVAVSFNLDTRDR